MNPGVVESLRSTVSRRRGSDLGVRKPRGRERCGGVVVVVCAIAHFFDQPASRSHSDPVVSGSVRISGGKVAEQSKY